MNHLLRWLCLIPAYLIGGVLGFAAFYLMGISVDSVALHDFLSGPGLGYSFIACPTFAIAYGALTSAGGIYAGTIMAPTHRRQVAWVLGAINALLMLAWAYQRFFQADPEAATVGAYVKTGLALCGALGASWCTAAALADDPSVTSADPLAIAPKASDPAM